LEVIPIWVLKRPDAWSALENPKVLSALPRYVDVVKNRHVAKFLISQMVPADYSEDSSAEELWTIHKRALASETELEESLDEDKVKIGDLQPPKRSLLHLKHLIGRRILESCVLCERRCMKNRLGGKFGYCRVGDEMKVSSYFDHMGEEPEIVPSFTVYDQRSAELVWAATSGASTARTGG
jgi:putative pyruvate formate lyase activating enzyme